MCFMETNRLSGYSKVPNKRACLFFFEKKSDQTPSSPLLLGPHRLLIFGFSCLAPKNIEQCKTYLSIRNSIKSNEIYFSECFRFQCCF